MSYGTSMYHSTLYHDTLITIVFWSCMHILIIYCSVDGAMSRCCYNDEDLLIYTTDSITGSFSARSHRDGVYPYTEKYTVPQFSYLYHDVAPYLGCCGWPVQQGHPDTSTCVNNFLTYRPSVDCRNEETYRQGKYF